MKDELLSQIEALIAEPIELLNLPALDRMIWENKLFDLAELLEHYRTGRQNPMAKSIAAQIEGGVDAPY